MSVKLYRAAISSNAQTTAPQQAVLLNLAWHANEDDGTCFPGIATIARETRLGLATVKRALAELCKIRIDGVALLERVRRCAKTGGFASSSYSFPAFMSKSRSVPASGPGGPAVGRSRRAARPCGPSPRPAPAALPSDGPGARRGPAAPGVPGAAIGCGVNPSDEVVMDWARGCLGFVEDDMDLVAIACMAARARGWRDENGKQIKNWMAYLKTAALNLLEEKRRNQREYDSSRVPICRGGLEE